MHHYWPERQEQLKIITWSSVDTASTTVKSRIFARVQTGLGIVLHLLLSQFLAAVPHVDKQQAEQKQTGQEIDPCRPLEIRAGRTIAIDVALASSNTHTVASESSVGFLNRRRVSLTTVLVVIVRSIGGNVPKPTLIRGFTGLTNGLDRLTRSWQRSLCIDWRHDVSGRRRVRQLSGRLAVKVFGAVAPVLHK